MQVISHQQTIPDFMPLYDGVRFNMRCIQCRKSALAAVCASALVDICHQYSEESLAQSGQYNLWLAEAFGCNRSDCRCVRLQRVRL
jgi:hypothetical protein